MLCRYCFEEETEESNKLFAPCECTGSVKYVHEVCLKEWIKNSEKKLHKYTKNLYYFLCELCKGRINLKVNYKHSLLYDLVKFVFQEIFSTKNFHKNLMCFLLFGLFYKLGKDIIHSLMLSEKVNPFQISEKLGRFCFLVSFFSHFIMNHFIRISKNFKRDLEIEFINKSN